MGLLCAALFALTQFLGSLLFGSLNVRFHRYLGTVIYWGMMSTCVLGTFEKQYFKAGDTPYSIECMLANGLMLLLLAITVCTTLQFTFLPTAKACS